MGKKIIKPIAARADGAISAKAALAIAAARPADALFSKGRQRVLTVLFGEPERSFYTNEVIAMAGVGTGGVQRELASLAEAGLVQVSRQGNRKHFQANPGSVVAAEIYSLVRKTLTLAGVLGAALAPRTGDIELALAHGTPVQLRDTAHDDINLLLVSDSLDDDDLTQLLLASATALGRRLVVTLRTRAEHALRKDEDYALAGAAQESNLWLIGSPQRPSLL